MTQYPSPYSPPPAGYGMSYGYGVPEDLLAPARRAGLLMIILGALTIVVGLCMGLCSVMLPQMLDQMQPDQRDMFDQMQQRIPFSLSTFLLIMAIMMLAVGIIYIILGLFTRRGGMGIVITSIVLTTLVTLFLLISTVGSLFQPNGAAGACMSIVVLGLFILLLVWLIQAARRDQTAELAGAVSSTISAVFTDAADVWASGIRLRRAISGAITSAAESASESSPGVI